MTDCYICGRENTKYSCILCDNKICNVCAESATNDEVGYDEENYRVGKCPSSKCRSEKSVKLTEIIENKVSASDENSRKNCGFNLLNL